MQALIERSSGILLHISSLPSRYGIGDMGHNAYKFINYLSKSKQSYWQILPLNPVSYKEGNSPYSSVSAFAGNTLLIEPEFLLKCGFISKEDLDRSPNFETKYVDYRKVANFKNELFEKAHYNFQLKRKKTKCKKEFAVFCDENDIKWLDDFSRFVAFKKHFESSAAFWNYWPEDIKERKKDPIDELARLLKDEIEKTKFTQYIFYKQWFLLKEYANSCNIKIIGDIPLYVDFNSSDVWANSQFFKLDKDKNKLFVAGVPPDYYSNIGQLWGNPVYNWKILKKDKYKWWIKRLEHVFKLYDLTRIDHFRGLVSYWEVKAGEKDAINGKWVKAFPDDFISSLIKHFNKLPIIAEDLGGTTADVQDIIRKYNIAGIKVLIFAFIENFPQNPYLPHNYRRNCVAYTGTHDNNPVKGWFLKEARLSVKDNLAKYLGRKPSENTVHKDFVRLIMSSVANLTVIPLQDILGLGETARMNRPSVSSGCWRWRFSFDQLSPKTVNWFREMTEDYDRVGPVKLSNF